MAEAAFDEGYGRHFGKFDIERIGIFGEMSYMQGKGYVSPFAREKRDPLTKGIGQMLTGVPKVKTGLQDCYFDHEFHRLFIKEAWINPTTVHRAERLADLKKRAGGDFIPPAAPKKRSGSGDYYGTFGGVVSEFSPLKRKEPKRKKEPANFLTNPGKKGGSGYPDICFEKYPEHLTDTFGGDPAKVKALRQEAKMLAGPFIGICYPTYFEKDPNHRLSDSDAYYVKPKKEKVKVTGTGIWIPNSPAKKDGGCKDGTLNKWPTHVADTAPPQKKKKDTTGIFYPQARNKSMYTQSISFKKIDITLNNKNWLTYDRTSFPKMV